MDQNIFASMRVCVVQALCAVVPDLPDDLLAEFSKAIKTELKRRDK